MKVKSRRRAQNAQPRAPMLAAAWECVAIAARSAIAQRSRVARPRS